LKNQNDLVISIVLIVVALITVGIFYGTKPEVRMPAKAPQVPIQDKAVDGAAVRYTNGLGGGSGSPVGGGSIGSRGGGPSAGGVSTPGGGGGTTPQRRTAASPN
jgi:hypothetical protein